MATKKKKIEPVVRCFEVGQPTLHPKGHTIYKITQRVIHVEAPEKEVEESQVWRRYNDCKKLYEAMFKLHKALHRRDEFPPFARSKVFGRFDETVIIERMRSAQDLLNFVGQRVYMVNSKAFQQFFEGAEKIQPNTKTEEILQPSSLAPSLKLMKDVRPEDSSDTESLSSATDIQPLSEDPKGEQEIIEDLLGGVWKYRQVADEISLEGGSSDDQTDFTDDSALSTPLPDAELSFFDPLTMPEGLPQSTGSDLSNEWLLSAMTVCKTEDGHSEANSDALNKLGEELISTTSEDISQDTGVDLQSDARSTNGAFEQGAFGETSDPFDVKPKSGSVLCVGKGDLTMSPMHSEKSTPSHVAGSSHQNSPARMRGSVSSPAHSGKGSPLRSPMKVFSPEDLQDKADYIVMAANQISLAQQCEANNNYNMAFSYYKSGVGVLLTGVQKDENAQRREVVRRKTARYLIKAEELYHKYLADVEEQERNRWDTGQPSPAKELLTPNIAFLQGAMAEMRKFKVLGVVDKVILVMDPDTEGTYIIKVLQKRCSMPAISQKSIIPNYIPYMVRLYKFFETDSAIFLLLQYASGGKLWTYAGAYLNQHQHDFEMDVLDDPREKQLRSRSSTKSSKTDSAHTTSTFTANDAQVKIECPDLNSLLSDSQNRLDNENFVELYMNETAGYSKAKEIAHDDDDWTIEAPNIKSPNLALSRVKQSDRRDSDFLSLDGSQDTPTLQKALSNTGVSRKLSSISSSSEHLSRQNSETSGVNVSADHDGFRELLKDTRPALENFSINSFDSDSGPGSRYESTTSEHIESIPEVSENSPMSSPYRKAAHASPTTPHGDVFTDDTLTSNHALVNNAKQVIKDAESELAQADLDERGLLSERPSSHSTPRPKSLFPTGVRAASDSADEPSIYDTFKPAESEDSTSSCSPVSSPLKLNNAKTPALAQADVKDDFTIDTKSATTRADAEESSEESKTEASDSSTPRSTKAEVFRQPSQERSVETPLKPRKRNLSSVFAELDLAEDERRRKLIRLPEGCVRQWAAELIVAVAQLHSMGIIIGDLHPDNILLGERGHILLTYQCQWALVDHRRRDNALVQGYAAPEMAGIGVASQACDWWSVGTLLYELLTGNSFGLHHPTGITTHTQIQIPDDLSTESQSLLQELLRFDPQERLGSGLDGSADIRLHPFFNGIQWNELQGHVLT